jgi:hypothetical protein
MGFKLNPIHKPDRYDWPLDATVLLLCNVETRRLSNALDGSARWTAAPLGGCWHPDLVRLRDDRRLIWA